MEEKYLIPALDLVENAFTAHSDAEEGKLVRTLVEELVPGGLNGIHGQVCYSDYECLR